MRPALSVIVFTVLSGFGYGLFIVLAVMSFLNPTLDAGVGVIACLVGLVLVTGGLLSSTLHLANPKNAWRAFSRFRTSWLSREGVLALVFYLPALLYLAGWWFGFGSDTWRAALSVLVMVLALATVFATGMIYGCLKTIRQWNTPMTPVNYIMLAVMSGALLLLFLHQLHTGGRLPGFLTVSLVFVIVTCGVVKYYHYVMIVDMKGWSTLRDATSLPSSSVRLLDVGHTAGTFLTDEFGYQVAARRLKLLRTVSMVLVFVVPVLLLAVRLLGVGGTAIIAVALLSSLVGLLIERWLFFADARHVVNLYHGTLRSW